MEITLSSILSHPNWPQIFFGTNYQIHKRMRDFFNYQHQVDVGFIAAGNFWGFLSHLKIQPTPMSRQHLYRAIYFYNWLYTNTKQRSNILEDPVTQESGVIGAALNPDLAVYDSESLSTPSWRRVRMTGWRRCQERVLLSRHHCCNYLISFFFLLQKYSYFCARRW